MRFYKLLLHLYPASFRHEYGAELCQVFAEHRQRTRGVWPVLALWMETIAEILRDVARVHLDVLRQDLKYAARAAAQAPGFALTVILVAGLGIGATTTVFSLADHVLIRPLPLPESDRLVGIWERQREYWMETSPVGYRDWQRLSKSFSAMGAYTTMEVNLSGQSEPVRVEGTLASAELFEVLGVQPLAGRLFTGEDDREGASGTVLISHHLWQTGMGGSRDALGRKVLLDGEPYLVIGVMPRDFYFPDRETQFWRTFRFGPRDYEDRQNYYLNVLGRLKPGVSVENARAEMELIAGQLARQYPNGGEENGARVLALRERISTQARMLLTVLASAALCLLLIACINVANLMLARAIARRQELAVRTALGAGRERLVRQLLTESVLLATLGGAVGVVLGWFALPLLTRLVPISLPIAEVPPLDLRVLGFAAAITLLTGIAFGVIPALRSPADAMGALREGNRGGVGGRKQRLRSALVLAEVTASVLLLACSGLLLRALWQVQGRDPGFRSDGVLTMRTALSWPKYAKTAIRFQFFNRVLDEVKALPGVTHAGYTSFLPMTMRGGIWSVKVPGRTPRADESDNASIRFVTPGYFAAMGIPLKQGRDVGESDTMETQQMAVVSESFARKYFPDKDPIGQQFEFSYLRMRTIAGVVGDVRFRGMERNNEPQVYIPYRQAPDNAFIYYTPKDLVIRTVGDPLALAPTVRAIVRRADPEQPISNVQTLGAIVSEDTAPRRVQVTVLGGFAAISFLLAAIGMYGLLSFAVSQRQQEIGVRMALGAPRGNIVSLLLRHMLLLAAAGTACGVALAYAAGRWLSSLLAGIAPADPLSLSTAVGLALLMTLLGSLLPTLRAVRIDPVIAMRNE